MHNTNHAANDLVYILQAHPAAIIVLNPENGTTRTILELPRGTPDGIQVDYIGNSIYWTNMGQMPASGEDFFDTDGAIECCDLDGNNHRILVSDGLTVTPKQIQLDQGNAKLYWCDREGMAVFSCGIDGSHLTELIRTGTWPDDSKDEVRHCVGIAIDVAHQHIYWTQKGPPDGGLGRIFRMNFDPKAGTASMSSSEAVLLLDNLPEPIDLEIDHDSQQLYWTDRGNPAAGGNSLNRADIVDGALKNHQVLATGLKEGIGLALDFKNRRAFVSDLSGTIRTVPMDGGRFMTICTLPGLVTGLAFVPSRG